MILLESILKYKSYKELLKLKKKKNKKNILHLILKKYICFICLNWHSEYLYIEIGPDVAQSHVYN